MSIASHLKKTTFALAALLAGISWQQEDIVLFGEPRRVPRLVAWHGDPGTAYTYPGTAHEPLP